MAKKKVDSKVLSQAKRRRRRLLTFVRMIRYGVNNFSRNAWLTIAATAVMTITLLIIFTTVVARDVLSNTVQTIQDKVEMTIYIDSKAKPDAVNKVAGAIRSLNSVREVTIVTPEEARQRYIDENKADPQSLNALNNSDANFTWRIRTKMVDINKTSELQAFVDNDADLKKIISHDQPASFDGPNRVAIQRIGGWVHFADRAGIIAGSVFVIISSLIIFNTIRMAIFNRREEIHMMKLIGAERSFIRGPFVVEAIVYGFIAAILATGLGVFAVYSVRDTFAGNGIAVYETLNWLLAYSPLVLLAMMVIGALIGIVSSLLATQRYLKL